MTVGTFERFGLGGGTIPMGGVGSPGPGTYIAASEEDSGRPFFQHSIIGAFKKQLPEKEHA